MKTTQEFEKIYSNYWEKLYVFAYKMTGDSNLSKNIIQDVFTNLWERRAEINIISIENFLFRAVKNHILKFYRQQKHNPSVLDETLEKLTEETSEYTSSDYAEFLTPLLEKLPEKRREILLMNKLQEMNIDQIAEELQLSKQTVKNQLSSALRQIRIELAQLSWLLLGLISGSFLLNVCLILS
ncbi:RNA polymerase sigma factor [Cellulophaga baltica]|jgi:RNA polymerase sigma-70 factor (ECF subfamily)|uniref:RNA polymerase sigma factor n=1 Tax=Cellulophaga baltica TaxID=76594 RepID=UPI000400ADDB|nr:RNA polymerase sigma-70 factor [Cellulophaga baltica]MBA6314010.1 RNA polymerase sigma-70 factor [Cellulophaga baltica]MCR1025636.1 RNA polymerase sigma-70 factor [Cellulophaga baltica]